MATCWQVMSMLAEIFSFTNDLIGTMYNTKLNEIFGIDSHNPTCFIKKSLFDEFGLYSLNYKVAGDFDFLVRIFYARDVSWAYLNRVTVKIRQGGVSNTGFSSKKLVFQEINQSLRSNNAWSLPIFQLGRYFIRLLELLIRSKSARHE